MHLIRKPKTRISVIGITSAGPTVSREEIDYGCINTGARLGASIRK
jgi:hypothetical protein